MKITQSFVSERNCALEGFAANSLGTQVAGEFLLARRRG
jgi:hypothetical protein